MRGELFRAMVNVAGNCDNEDYVNEEIISQGDYVVRRCFYCKKYVFKGYDECPSCDNHSHRFIRRKVNIKVVNRYCKRSFLDKLMFKPKKFDTSLIMTADVSRLQDKLFFEKYYGEIAKDFISQNKF